MPNLQKQIEYKRDVVFFRELEEVLDQYFPKVEEEGEEKRLMKRGDALMIFAEANRIHSRILAENKASLIAKLEGEKGKKHMPGEGFNAGVDTSIKIIKEL